MEFLSSPKAHIEGEGSEFFQVPEPRRKLGLGINNNNKLSLILNCIEFYNPIIPLMNTDLQVITAHDY